MFADRANAVIQRHLNEKGREVPFFLYLSLQSIHDPFQVSAERSTMLQNSFFNVGQCAGSTAVYTPLQEVQAVLEVRVRRMFFRDDTPLRLNEFD